MKLAADANKWGMPEPVTRNNDVSVKDLFECAAIPCREYGHHADFKMMRTNVVREAREKVDRSPAAIQSKIAQSQ